MARYDGTSRSRLVWLAALVAAARMGAGCGGADTPPPNEPPVGQADAFQVAEDGLLSVAAGSGVLANDTDPEGKPLAAAVATGPAHATLDLQASGAFSYTPAADWSGTDGFAYTVSDGARSAGPVAVTITVLPVNDPPVAAADSASTVDTAVSIAVLANDTDVDGDALAVSAVTQGAHGAVTHDGAQATYAPEAGFVGQDAFGYTVADGHGGTDQGVVTVSVGGWFELGASAFAPWSVRVEASASGGGVSASLAASAYPALAFGPGGKPVIAWQEPQVGASKVYLRRWNGTAWEEVDGSASGGGVSASADPSARPDVAVDSQGRMVVAWEEYVASVNYEIHVRRFNGAAWEELDSSATGGGLSGTAAASRYPAAGIGAADAPVVAWLEDQSLYLKRWNAAASAWEELGGSATGGGVSGAAQASAAFSVALAFDPAGRPTVAWEGFFGGSSRAFVKQWDGASWTELGGSATSGVGSGVSTHLSLAVDAGGRPVIAWNTFVSGGSPGLFSGEIYVARWDGSAWVGVPGSVGGEPVSDMEALGLAASQVALTVTSDGDPVVAWRGEHVGRPGEIFLRRWNGVASSWEDLAGSGTGGGVSANSGGSVNPALAMAGDTPALAWSDETSGGTEIYYREWSGTTWAETHATGGGGGASATAGASVRPDLAVDGAGHPAVAWRDDGIPSRGILLKRFDGATWAELAGSATGTGIGPASFDAHPSLVLDADAPVVAWHGDRTPANPEVYLARFDGGAWTGLGGSYEIAGISDSPDYSECPALALCGAGRPALAWLEAFDSLFLLGWDGLAWGAFGPSATAGLAGNVAQYQGEPPLAAACDAGGNPVAAWTQYGTGQQEIYLLRWDGADWVELGGSGSGGGVSNTPGRSLDPELALDSNGNPVVAWQDDTSGRWQAYLRAWDGADWVELDSSGSGGGVSASSGGAGAPALALDSSGRAAVAWQDTARGNTEIYLRRFDGVSWRELAGSATAGGVSNSSGRSDAPAVAAGGGFICVAWQEGGATSLEILVRCHWE